MLFLYTRERLWAQEEEEDKKNLLLFFQQIFPSDNHLLARNVTPRVSLSLSAIPHHTFAVVRAVSRKFTLVEIDGMRQSRPVVLFTTNTAKHLQSCLRS